MLPIKNDFSTYDRIEWSTEHEVGIRFLVELLAHSYGKRPEKIIEIFCLCNEDLPRLRYEEEDIDESADPQWKLCRYHTALHAKVLLSNTLESSSWDHVPNNSIYCREEIKYKGTTFPDASVDEIIFETGSETGDIRGITRIITPRSRVPLENFWASRDEFENYLSDIPALSAWLDMLPKKANTPDNSAIRDQAPPEWVLRRAGGDQWHCGPEERPGLVGPLKGCRDLHFAISNRGEDCPHLEYLAENDEQTAVARALQFSTSFDVLSQVEMQRLSALIESVEAELESAQIAGDIEKEQEIQDKLTKILDYQKSSTMPGGKSRRMTEGDPSAKAARAMRERRRVLVDHLEKAGLDDVAKHVGNKMIFRIRTKTFSYNTGPPYPEWKLG